MTAKPNDAAQANPRPDLDALYKPVGINAVTAATLCNKSKKAGAAGK
ncbi:hypothetical protein [Stappia sp.]